MSKMKYIAAALGLTAANFLLNEYAIAFERTFFQLVTILAVWGNSLLCSKGE